MNRRFLALAGLLSTLAFGSPDPAHSQASAAQEPKSEKQESLRTLVEIARAFRGAPYVYGGEDPEEGFDCSGYVQYLMRAFGVKMPRTAAQQAKVGKPVPKAIDALQPGDLLTFGYKGKVSHIGVYIGGGKYLHASSGKGKIVEARIDKKQRGYKPWIGVRRVIEGEPENASDRSEGI